MAAVALRNASVLVVAVAAIVLLGALPWAAAQDKAAEPEAGPALLDDRYRPHIAAAEVVGVGDPLTVIAMLQRGLQGGVWMGKPSRGVLVDKDQVVGIEHRTEIQPFSKNRWEAAAYCYLVLHARDVSNAELAKAARTDVPYGSLWNDPVRFQGEPIRISGRLGRLVKMDAPSNLWNDGVKTLYEGWIYPDEKDGDNPYCVVFTELPKGVELGERVNYQVSCDAFFFKLYRYETKERKDNNRRVRRDAPMFIARTFAQSSGVRKPSDDEDSPFTGTLIPGVLIFVGGLIALFLVLSWFFRRGDRQVQSRIRDARTSDFVPPPPDDGPMNGSSQKSADSERRETFQ